MSEGGLVKGCGGNHYEIYGGTKTPDAEGWTYHKCHSCGQKWRSKTITEML